jgi:hypothetical protein
MSKVRYLTCFNNHRQFLFITRASKIFFLLASRNAISDANFRNVSISIFAGLFFLFRAVAVGETEGVRAVCCAHYIHTKPRQDTVLAFPYI